MAKDLNVKEPKTKEEKVIALKGNGSKGAETKGKEQKTAEHRKPNAIRRFFNETIGELRKVSWPTRKEAINLTIVVIGVLIGSAALLGVLDFLFTKLFALILA